VDGAVCRLGLWVWRSEFLARERVAWAVIDDQNKDMLWRGALSSSRNIVGVCWSCRDDSQPIRWTTKGQRRKSEVELGGGRDLRVVNPRLRFGRKRREPKGYNRN